MKSVSKKAVKYIQKLAFVCPGQGGQYVGMIEGLQKLNVYNEVMHCAKEALDEDGVSSEKYKANV